MRHLKIMTAIVCFLCLPFLALAAEPPDSLIKGALADIARYESQFSRSSTPQKSAIKRALKLLELTRQRLDSSKNQTHETWQLADTRYKALVTNLQTHLTIKGPTTASSPNTATNKTAGGASAAKPKTNSPANKARMISQDHVRVKKLGRDIASATDTLDKGGPKPFQDPAYVEKFVSAYKRYHQSLQKYAAFGDDPGVQHTTAELEKMKGMILFGKDQAKTALEELGDVQGRLLTLQTHLRSRRPPDAPGLPYTSDGISNWFKQAKLVRSQTVTEYPPLEVIREKAWLPVTRGTVEQGAPFDMQDVSRLMHSLQSNVQSIDDTLKQLEANLEIQVEQIGHTLEWFNALDPADKQGMQMSFLGEGREAESLQRLNKEFQIAEAAITFDKLLERKTLAQRESVRDSIEQAKTQYRVQREKALQLVRMPKPASTNSELIQIAKDTLANPNYETGDIIRIIINSDKVTRESESSQIDIDDVDVGLSGKVKMSGTQTTTRYKWEQYQVATAEPVNDKFFIFYNTLKYYTAGGTTTPLNQWIRTGRIQGNEIPKKNINLD